MKTKQILNVSDVLGRCTINGLTGLFLPIVKLKAKLSELTARFHELQKSILKEAGIYVNEQGIIPEGTSIKALDLANESIDKLANEESELKMEDYKILTEADFSTLGKDNPKLTVAELEQLLILVKE